MGATPFRHIDFVAHQPITKEVMDQFQQNVQWIADSTPITLYSDATGSSTISSLIVVGGRVVIPFAYGKGTATVNFNGAFDSTAQPHVTTGMISSKYKHLWATLNGIGTAIFPDSRGFEISVQTNEALIASVPTVSAYWMAIGKRSPNYERF